MTIEYLKYLKINSINLLNLIFSGNKYLTLIPTNESKEKNKVFEELWCKFGDLIRSIIKNSDHYDEKYMKMKFNLYDELLLNKVIEIPIMTIVVRAVFHENNMSV